MRPWRGIVYCVTLDSAVELLYNIKEPIEGDRLINSSAILQNLMVTKLLLKQL